MTKGAPVRALVPLGVALAAYGHITRKFLHWNCPMRTFFHIPCPTCGMTTATRALLHLELHAAMHENPLAPIVIPFVVVLGAAELASYVRTGQFGFWSRPGKTKSAVRIAGIAMCVALFVVWVARFFGAFGGPHRA
ncbi:MAG TPA: DUF2752 domain-containing protein [Polyangiaceae bacterium]|jgi:hypothetical protein